MSTRSLVSHQRNWEELAMVDAKWSVLTDPQKRNSWDDSEFFATGEQEIGQLLCTLRELGYPKGFATALDFGCGVGRLTKALVKRFEHTWGVDISARMLAEAKRNVPRASLLLNQSTRIPFADGFFDLVYTARVLQHLPHPDFIVNYIREFLRVIGPQGIAVFHVPTHVALVHRVQPRRRLYGLLRACGVDPTTLIKLNLSPMHVTGLSERRLLNAVRASNCRVIHVDTASCPVRGAASSTYYVVGNPDRTPAPTAPYAAEY